MCDLSVIMPIYNVAAFLDEAIEAILTEKTCSMEVILVDDGSTDGCSLKVKKWKAKDPRVVTIHKKNGGAASARNAGIAVAKGRYLYFPDADDVVYAGYIKSMLMRMEEAGADLLMTGYVVSYADGHSYRVKPKPAIYEGQASIREHMGAYLDNMILAVPWNKLYRADLIKENGLSFPETDWDDLYFNLDVLEKADRVLVEPFSGYRYRRMREGSSTQSIYEGKLFEKRKDQFEKIKASYQSWGLYRKKEPLLYGYYAGRLIECIAYAQGEEDGGALLRRILADPDTKRAFRIGRPVSFPLSLCRLFLRISGHTGAAILGRFLFFMIKTHPKIVNSIKTRSVNGGVEEGTVHI